MKMKGWPFEPLDKDVEPLGSGEGPGRPHVLANQCKENPEFP